MVGSFILGIFVQVIVILIPQLAEIFKLVPLTGLQWGITLVISILPVPIMEIQKFFDRRVKKESILIKEGISINNV